MIKKEKGRNGLRQRDRGSVQEERERERERVSEREREIDRQRERERQRVKQHKAKYLPGYYSMLLKLNNIVNENIIGAPEMQNNYVDQLQIFILIGSLFYFHVYSVLPYVQSLLINYLVIVITLPCIHRVIEGKKQRTVYQR